MEKIVYMQYCKDELTEEGIPHDEMSTFSKLFTKKLLEMNNFISKVDEWRRFHKQPIDKNQSSPYNLASPKRTDMLKNSKKEYARTKIAERRAKYEAEKLNWKKLLELRKSERQIEDQIEELEFQRKGKELEILEKNLKRYDIARPPCRDKDVLQEKKLVAANHSVLVAFQEQSITLQQGNVINGNDCQQTTLKENENNQTEKKYLENDVDLVRDEEIYINHYQFGWIVSGPVNYERDKIKAKCFHVSQKELRLVKQKIECFYNNDFLDYFGKEKIFCKIYYKMNSYTFKTILSSVNNFLEQTVDKNLLEIIEDANYDSVSFVEGKKQKRALLDLTKTVPSRERFKFELKQQILKSERFSQQINLDTILTKNFTYYVISKQSYRNLSSIAFENSVAVQTFNWRFQWSVISFSEPILLPILPWALWIEIICRLKNYKYPR